MSLRVSHTLILLRRASRTIPLRCLAGLLRGFAVPEEAAHDPEALFARCVLSKKHVVHAAEPVRADGIEVCCGG